MYLPGWCRRVQPNHLGSHQSESSLSALSHSFNKSNLYTSMKSSFLAFHFLSSLNTLFSNCLPNPIQHLFYATQQYLFRTKKETYTLRLVSLKSRTDQRRFSYPRGNLEFHGIPMVGESIFLLLFLFSFPKCSYRIWPRRRKWVTLEAIKQC